MLDFFRDRKIVHIDPVVNQGGRYKIQPQRKGVTNTIVNTL